MHLPIGQLEGMPEEMKASMFSKIKMFKRYEIMLYKAEKSEIITDEIVIIVKKILGVIPDYYPGWNILKIYSRKSNLNTEDLESQLNFNESCFRVKQKSYPTFFHRKWLLKEYPELFKYTREQNLIDYILGKDPRNFHAWDYKTYISTIYIDYNKDLDFSSKMIKRNVYNSGAFNFRIQTLRKMSCIDMDLIKSELEFFIEILIMDANNECLFYYLDFILDSYNNIKNEVGNGNGDEKVESVINEIKEILIEVKTIEKTRENMWIDKYVFILERIV